jgi:hypothetical protein
MLPSVYHAIFHYFFRLVLHKSLRCPSACVAPFSPYPVSLCRIFLPPVLTCTLICISPGYYLLPANKLLNRATSDTVNRSWKPNHAGTPTIQIQPRLLDAFTDNHPCKATLRELVERDIGLALLTTDKPGYQDKNIPILYNTWLKGFEGALKRSQKKLTEFKRI